MQFTGTSANKTTTVPKDNLFDVDTEMELTDINKIASDFFHDSSDEITTDRIKSESLSNNDNVYNFIKNRLLTLDPETTMALGHIAYHIDFHPHYFQVPPDKEGHFGKTLYQKKTPNRVADDGSETAGDELGLVFFGEVCDSGYGTAISAKGNYYAGPPKYPKVFIVQFSLIFIVL